MPVPDIMAAMDTVEEALIKSRLEIPDSFSFFFIFMFTP
jgi:hypothetical protein